MDMDRVVIGHDRAGVGALSDQGWVFEEGSESDLLQLRYLTEDGNLHTLRAADVARVIQGVVELTEQMRKAGAFGDGPAPQLELRPVAEGSFVLEFVETAGPFLQDNAAVIGGTLAVGQIANASLGKVGKAIKWGMRAMSTPMKAVHDYDSDHKLIEFADGTQQMVEKPVADLFLAGRKKTKQALRKIGTPMADEADVMEVREGHSSQTTEEVKAAPAEAVIVSTEYQAVAAVDESLDVDETDTFTTSGQIRSLDFDNLDKWRMQTLEGTWNVTIDDPDFKRKLAQGWGVRPDDVYEVTIEERTTRSGEAQRATVTRTATEVRLLKRGAEGGDDSTP